MQIKIKKCGNRKFWYNEQTGKIFNVVGRVMLKSKPAYSVQVNNEKNGYVWVDDAEEYVEQIKVTSDHKADDKPKTKTGDK